MRAFCIVLACLFLTGCGLPQEQIAETTIAVQTQEAALINTPSATTQPNLKETQKAFQTATPTQAFNANTISTEFAKPTITAIAKAGTILDEIRAANEADKLDLSKAKLVYGPRDHTLTHTLKNIVIVDDPGLVMTNFIASIRFVNPYDTSTTGKWDYGILFRNKYGNNQYRLTLLSNRSWTLRNENRDTYIYSSNDKNIKAKAGEENMIWLIAIDSKAYIFINGIYTKTLDIGTPPSEGDISPATGLYYGNLTKKRITEYKDFTVWFLP